MIQDAIRQAQQMHRKNIEATYDETCCIYEYQNKKNIKTNLTESKPVLVAENVPCHRSYSSIPTAYENEAATNRKQTIKLFLAPEIVIKAGSKITVTRNGDTQEYSRSGEPAIYASHQEINLELFRGWA